MSSLDDYLNNPAPKAPEYREEMKSPHAMAAMKFKDNRALNPQRSADSGTMVVEIAQDGNFTPKGFEATPFDETGLAVARGEEQRDTDPKAVAGLDELMPQLADKIGAITARLRRNGITRVAPTVKRKDVTVKGIRGMDAAERRKVQDAAHASDRAYLDAVRALDKAFEQYIEWRFDHNTGLVRPVRVENATWA
jgi:hypothetical protein